MHDRKLWETFLGGDTLINYELRLLGCHKCPTVPRQRPIGPRASAAKQSLLGDIFGLTPGRVVEGDVAFVQGSDPVKLTHDATLGNRVQVGTLRVEISTNVGTSVARFLAAKA